MQRTGPQVEHSFVRDQLAVPHVEGLVVDEQPDRLAVGHVDDRLARFGKAVTCLGVRQWAQFVEGVQVGAGQPVRLALVEVAPQSDVPVGQGEDRLRLGQHVQVEPGFPDVPGLGEGTITTRTLEATVAVAGAAIRRQDVRNGRIASELGVALRYPTYREGLAALWRDGTWRG